MTLDEVNEKITTIRLELKRKGLEYQKLLCEKDKLERVRAKDIFAQLEKEYE